MDGGVHTEAESNRVAGCWIGILPHYEHLDVAERVSKGAQDIFSSWQILMAGSQLVAKEFAHLMDIGLNGREGLGPTWIDDVREGTISLSVMLLYVSIGVFNDFGVEYG